MARREVAPTTRALFREYLRRRRQLLDVLRAEYRHHLRTATDRLEQLSDRQTDLPYCT